ncbi:peptide-methionine (S)-S-oxide reductase MsrA [Synechocystis sp. LKSZ1]|uniref:peptide-methionine (S)-S-oxide reductase MsrA n=1 Tax=Synechocystis sp. LKSZ1 TaxID=3144951 RepID=UPI00336BB301
MGLVVTALSFLLKPSFRVIPDPGLDQPLSRSGETPKEIAVFAGGCFWGLEAMFEQVRGVETVLTGYSGGTAETANYPRVSGGGTDHAESIQITYDPSQVSYGELLKIFFAVGHDPTQVNRQGADVGRQYRSAIFATTPEQRAIAQAYLEQLKASGLFEKPIVTEINIFQAFYPAEDYHQDFVAHHPAHPYVLVHDIPKLQKFRQAFPDKLKS